MSTATFVMGVGENLWRRFLPKYLESLGAPVIANRQHEHNEQTRRPQEATARVKRDYES